jgi:carboxypeptidase Taq
MHEFGHALYELQQDPRLATTPLVGGVSLGIHESQSRFWENIVGRSPWYMPVLKKMVDETLGLTRGLSPEELYRYVNTVKPSLIRVDADEVTYNLHIYLRYSLEKHLIEGSLRVDELPEAWSELSEKLLGVKPRSHAEGVLQDIHWSHGSIGYFPTYTLGNVAAAMIWSSLSGPGSEMLQRLDIAGIQEWLRDRIHRWGRIYPPKELLARSLGAPEGYEAEKLVEYLEWKYLRLPNEADNFFPRA